MRRATTWDGLRGVLKDAQAAFDGEIIDPVEGEIQIPTNALQDTATVNLPCVRAIALVDEKVRQPQPSSRRTLAC
jgi:hypothetical protein